MSVLPFSLKVINELYRHFAYSADRRALEENGVRFAVLIEARMKYGILHDCDENSRFGAPICLLAKGHRFSLDKDVREKVSKSCLVDQERKMVRGLQVMVKVVLYGS